MTENEKQIEKVRKKALFSSENIIGKVPKQVFEQSDSVAIAFTDGTYIIFEAVRERYDEGIEINCVTADIHNLVRLGLITEKHKETYFEEERQRKAAIRQKEELEQLNNLMRKYKVT